MERPLELVPMVDFRQREIENPDAMVYIVNHRKRQVADELERALRKRRRKIRRIVNKLIDGVLTVTCLIGLGTIVVFLLSL